MIWGWLPATLVVTAAEVGDGLVGRQSWLEAVAIAIGESAVRICWTPLTILNVETPSKQEGCRMMIRLATVQVAATDGVVDRLVAKYAALPTGVVPAIIAALIWAVFAGAIGRRLIAFMDEPRAGIDGRWRRALHMYIGGR